MLIKLLSVFHKKLVRLEMYNTAYDTDCNREILHYLMVSNIEELIIDQNLNILKITAHELAKLFIKTKKIIINRIVFIDEDGNNIGDRPSIEKVLAFIKNKHILCKNYRFSTRSGMMIANTLQVSHLYIEKYYNFKFQIMSKINSTRGIIKRIENGEKIKIGSDLIESIINLPGVIIDEILDRL